MRIVACGDFHGALPQGFEKSVRALGPDVVLCTGDFYDNDFLRDVEFRYWALLGAGMDYGRILEMAAGKKLKDVYHHMVESGTRVVARLDGIGVPVVAVSGNGDYLRPEKKRLGIGPALEDIVEKCDNVTLLKRRAIRVRGLDIVGHSAHSAAHFPVDAAMKSEERELDRIFSGAAPGRAIFLTHNVPFNTALDVVRCRASPLYGMRAGDEIYRRVDLRHGPLLHVCGHMHENQGSCTLGRTLVVNAGYGRLGNMAVIDVGDGVSVRFIRR